MPIAGSTLRATNRQGEAESASGPSFNLIELFAGIGGLMLGFRDATREPRVRFLPRLMVDVDRDARDGAIRNFPDVPYLLSDIHGLSGSDIRNQAGLGSREPVHVLIGGQISASKG